MEKFFVDNWPLLAVVAWLAYKWWNTRRVSAMLPDLKHKGAVLLDVRTAAEYAANSAPDSLNIPLQELDRKSTRLNSSHTIQSRMPSSA